MVNPEDDTSILFKSVKDLAFETVQYIEKCHSDAQVKESKGVGITGIPTGFIDIDVVTGGLPYGLSVVGARPEDGLTDFGLNIALHASLNALQKYKVAYFNSQIPSKLLMRRLTSMASRIPMKDIREGYLAERDFPKMTKAIEGLIKTDGLRFCEVSLDPEQFYEACKRSQDTQGTQLIILDRLQSLFPTRNASGSDSYYWRGREVQGIFHDLITERGLALLVLSECKKKFKSERIQTDHLRDYGALEYNAHPIILLERDIESDDTHDSRGVVARISNNLEGQWTADVPLTYLKQYGRFESAAKVSDEE